MHKEDTVSEAIKTISLKQRVVGKCYNITDSIEDCRLLVTTFALLILLITIFGILSPRFFTLMTMTNILNRTSIYVILAVGMTLILTTGSIDISIGSQIGLVTAVLGLTISQAGVPAWAGIGIAVLLGAVLGSFNGFLISKIKVPAIITTLGTITFYRGLAYFASGGTVFMNFPDSYVFLGQGRVFFGLIPVPVIIAAVVVTWGHLFLKKTKRGAHIIATGGNVDAAKLSGINVAYSKFIVFLIMGVMAALAAIVMTARISAAQSVMGEGMEIHTISAVVLGGTSLFGGKATILGSVIGAVVLGVLETGLLLVRVSSFWQLVFMGMIFILVVTLRTYFEMKSVTTR